MLLPPILSKSRPLCKSFLLLVVLITKCYAVDKKAIKNQVLEMFKHGYDSYMKYAYPADELMPLSCKGRFRGVTTARGDVDDSLGNFSLTLIDSLDTLVVLGQYDDFESAVRRVTQSVSFDTDVIVSVFEVNIRVVGGLLGGHLMALALRRKHSDRLRWYNDELLHMAKDIATRLLPAFNSSSGVPFPRVNLKYGLLPSLKNQQDTCTACAGTILLEFATLSRLTGERVFEEKAHKAMDFLWLQRHRGSDLMGTVLNVHNGDWVRRDAGIGAGIDSYYEYCLKAYILLGQDAYLHRFNKHYEGVMRYISQGPLFVDVHMHKPTVASRSFMDALLAFWPGLQVLKGDVKQAIEGHEMLYHVIKRHQFLPEAFTHDFQVHWGQSPLRPEFVESTYFLYKATKDPHYLRVGQQIVQSMNTHVRVRCGFAGVKDVRTMEHEDRMDSYVLAETFKYLYMLFAEPDELIFDPDDYIFTTEAHLLPLSIAERACAPDKDLPPVPAPTPPVFEASDRSCPNTRHSYGGEMSTFAQMIREKIQKTLDKIQNGAGKCTPHRKRATVHPKVLTGNVKRRTNAKAVDKHSSKCAKKFVKTIPLTQQAQTLSSAHLLKASEFSATNPQHLEFLRRMGITMLNINGKVQLLQTTNTAASIHDAEAGTRFMQDMLQIAQKFEVELNSSPPRVVQLISVPFIGWPVYVASPAQFGPEFPNHLEGVMGPVIKAVPFRACSPLQNAHEVRGKIVLVERSQCMFIEKVDFAQRGGAIAVIVIDHVEGTSEFVTPQFAMSGDGKTKVDIPSVFLFREQGVRLVQQLNLHPGLIVRIGMDAINPAMLFESFLLNPSIYKSTSDSIFIPECEKIHGVIICKQQMILQKDGRRITLFDDVGDGGEVVNDEKASKLSEFLDPRPIDHEPSEYAADPLAHFQNPDTYQVICETDDTGNINCHEVTKDNELQPFENLQPPAGSKPKLTPPPSCPKSKFPSAPKVESAEFAQQKNRLKALKENLQGMMNIQSCTTENEFELCNSVDERGESVTNVLTYHKEQLFLSPSLSKSELNQAKRDLRRRHKSKAKLLDINQPIATISNEGGKKRVTFHLHDNHVTNSAPTYNPEEGRELELKLYYKLCQQTNFATLTPFDTNVQVIFKLIRNSLGLTNDLFTVEDNEVLSKLTDKLELKPVQNDESVIEHSKEGDRLERDKKCEYNPQLNKIECTQTGVINRNGG